MIWFDQFEEDVLDALQAHVSLDLSLPLDDQQYEARNFVQKLAEKLRAHGVRISERSSGN